MTRTIKPLFILIFCPFSLHLTAQSGFFGNVNYGSYRKINGIDGMVNAYYSTRAVDINIGYLYHSDKMKNYSLGFTAGFRNFNVALKSKNLPFYDNSYHLQNVKLGNDGLELTVFGQRRLNNYVQFTAGLSGCFYYPGMASLSTQMLTNPSYQDTSLYQFRSYQVKGGVNYQTSGLNFTPGIQVGIDVRLSDKLFLSLGYKSFLNRLEGVSEFIEIEGITKSGGTETMGYSQSYNLPLRYVQFGLKYFLKKSFPK